MTTQTEALEIAIDYMNEYLEDYDAKYQRHPARESARNNILADIETVKEALSSPNGEAQQPQDVVRGLLSNEPALDALKWIASHDLSGVDERALALMSYAFVHKARFAVLEATGERA